MSWCEKKSKKIGDQKGLLRNPCATWHYNPTGYLFYNRQTQPNSASLGFYLNNFSYCLRQDGSSTQLLLNLSKDCLIQGLEWLRIPNYGKPSPFPENRFIQGLACRHTLYGFTGSQLFTTVEHGPVFAFVGGYALTPSTTFTIHKDCYNHETQLRLYETTSCKGGVQDVGCQFCLISPQLYKLLVVQCLKCGT